MESYFTRARPALMESSDSTSPDVRMTSIKSDALFVNPPRRAPFREMSRASSRLFSSRVAGDRVSPAGPMPEGGRFLYPSTLPPQKAQGGVKGAGGWRRTGFL